MGELDRRNPRSHVAQRFSSQRMIGRYAGEADIR